MTKLECDFPQCLNPPIVKAAFQFEVKEPGETEFKPIICYRGPYCEEHNDQLKKILGNSSKLLVILDDVATPLARAGCDISFDNVRVFEVKPDYEPDEVDQLQLDPTKAAATIMTKITGKTDDKAN